jgi:uncharacterized protein (TIGR03000 family)
MVRQRIAFLSMSLAAMLTLGVGSAEARAAGEGHGGGAGHLAGGFYRGGRYGGFGPGFRGYYGYPGWCGIGVGVGLGYGFGYGYGYPYYPYPYPYPYGYGPPVYVDVNGAPLASATPQPVPAGGQAVTQTGAQSAQNGQSGTQAGAPPFPLGQMGAGPVRLTDSDVLLSIRVPADAVVRINGEKTAQNGPRREFMSSGLAPGRTYTFAVTVQWKGSSGETFELERRVSVQGGERRNVDFLMPPPAIATTQ